MNSDSINKPESSILKTENDELKKKVKTLEESLSNITTTSTSQPKKAGAVEYDNLIKSKQDVIEYTWIKQLVGK